MLSQFEDLDVIGLVNISQTNRLRTWLSSKNVGSFWLDGAEVVDGRTFFAQATIDLPQPENMPPKSWNGFLDNLRSALYETQLEQIIFVWVHADRMLDHGLNDLIIASDVLTMVSREVGSHDAHYKHLKSFWAILLGTGPNFPE